MTLQTGYRDTCGRTVAAGAVGTADSGQTYLLQGTAGDFSVNGTQMVIGATALNSDRAATVDLLASDVNLTLQVGVSALPASGTLEVGAEIKKTDDSNYYRMAAVITTAGAVTLTINKRVTGTLTLVGTSATVAGLTVAPNVLFNLRISAIYDPVAGTNRFYLKAWAGGAAEPLGWNALMLDAALTGGTRVGPYARNGSAATGINALFDNIASSSHLLPFPAGADPMCADPAVAYPKQTVAQSLAAAIDAYMSGTIDPDAARVTAPTWVRISRSNWSSITNGWYGGSFGTVAFDTVEFNSGTPTDLTANPTGVTLGPGIWAVRAEIVLPSSTDMISGTLSLAGGTEDFRVDAGAQVSNLPAIGAARQVGTMVSNASGNGTLSPSISINSNTGNSLISYYAVTAYKVSDYF